MESCLPGTASPASSLGFGCSDATLGAKVHTKLCSQLKSRCCGVMKVGSLPDKTLFHQNRAAVVI